MYCIPLEAAIDVEQAGGKAVNLARAHALGFRAPATTVVVRRALRRFIDHTGLAAALAEYQHIRTQGAALEAAFAQLAATVRAAALPDDLRLELTAAIAALLADAPSGLAVRSSAVQEDSAVASFAGVFESTIGVRDVDSAVRAVVDCWLSAWAPRAMRYLERMGIEPVMDAMAVMLQPVVPATAAGVIVTADPDSGDPWQLVVHAARGLAVDLMSGSGTGDRYRLDWETGGLREQEIAGAEPVLTAARLTVIADAARRLDEAMLKRVDVEWALAADGLWIVQVRPLTALPPFQSPELRRLIDAGEPWQPAPFVLPLRSDQPPGFLTPLYADMSESELWYRYQPDDIVLTGIWRREADVHGYRYVDTGPRPTFFDYLTSTGDFEAWLDRNEARYRARWAKRHDELAEIAAIGRSALRDARTAAALIPATLAVRDRIWDLNSFGWSGPQALGWMCEAMLRGFLQAIDPALSVSDLIGGEDSHTFAVTVALQELGRSIRDERVRAAFAGEGLGDVLAALQERAPDCAFLRQYEAHCRRFGRTPPSWRGRPPFWRTPWDDGDAAAMRAIRSALVGEGRDVREVQREARRRRDQGEARVRAVLAAGPAADLDRFDRMLEWTRYWTQALNDRHGVVVGLLWERELIWGLGLRLAGEGLVHRPDDVLLLRAADLTAYAREGDAAAFARIFEERERAHQRDRRFAAPARIGGAPDAMPDHASPAPEARAQPGGVLTGRGFGRGRATGRARIVRALTPAVLDALTADDVLVVLDENAFAYADWHSLLMLVKGVVSVARPAHHLTQVAREIGAPVVGNLGAGLGQIEDGALVHVDAERGTVRIE